MVKRYDIDGVNSPGGRYSHVGEIGPNARLFHLAGQTGVAADGTIGAGTEEQCRIVYDNIKAVLAGCGLGVENIAKLTVFLTDPRDIEIWRPIQKDALGEVVPASTLLIVSHLARPEFKVEVEVVAAAD